MNFLHPAWPVFMVLSNIASLEKFPPQSYFYGNHIDLRNSTCRALLRVYFLLLESDFEFYRVVLSCFHKFILYPFMYASVCRWALLPFHLQMPLRGASNPLRGFVSKRHCFGAKKCRAVRQKKRAKLHGGLCHKGVNVTFRVCIPSMRAIHWYLWSLTMGHMITYSSTGVRFNRLFPVWGHFWAIFGPFFELPV